MFFHQRFVPGLAIYTYMVGDEKSRQCAVIDPTRDVDEYLRHRQAGGPADHAHPGDARPRRLRQRLGRAEGPAAATRCRSSSPAWAARSGRRRTPTRWSATATRSPSGSVRLKAIHTPGHTPEHVSLGAVRRHPERGHALAALHRRLPVRRRRGPARPAGRGGPQEAGPPAVPRASSASCRRCPTSPRSSPPTGPARSAARRSAPASSSTARLRAALQRGAPGAGRRPSGSRTLLQGMPIAPPYFRRMKKVNAEGPKVLGPELPGQKRFTRQGGPRAALRALPGPGRAPEGGVRRRPHPRLDQHPARAATCRPGRAGCCPTTARS